MFVSAPDREKLLTLSQSKMYRDSYLDSHVRARIAYQIQAIREKLGLSQVAFAEKIGMKQSVVSRLENPEYGKVTVQTLLQVAAALNIALSVRFCDYDEFLALAADVSPEALTVDDIHSTVARSSYSQARLRPITLSFAPIEMMSVGRPMPTVPGSAYIDESTGYNVVSAQAA